MKNGKRGGKRRKGERMWSEKKRSRELRTRKNKEKCEEAGGRDSDKKEKGIKLGTQDKSEDNDRRRGEETRKGEQK